MADKLELTRRRVLQGTAGALALAMGGGTHFMTSRRAYAQAADLASQQLRQTGMVVVHDHPDWGRIWIPGCPIQMDGFTPRLEPAPRLGEHTGEVLAELRRRH